MNKSLLFLNILSLAGIGVLFYLFLNKNNSNTGGKIISTSDSASKPEHTTVAYFDMDSIEANFILWKQVQAEVVKREAGINDSINQMRMNFQNYYQRLQSQGANFSTRQKDSLGNVLAEMDMEIKNKATELNQNYQTYYMSKQQEIVTKIKNFCKEFNKDNKYSYIIAKEPGLFYFTDTLYNVTNELLKGLNEFYAKKK